MAKLLIRLEYFYNIGWIILEQASNFWHVHVIFDWLIQMTSKDYCNLKYKDNHKWIKRGLWIWFVQTVCVNLCEFQC
mgnify:CR=1 FL=1